MGSSVLTLFRPSTAVPVFAKVFKSASVHLVVSSASHKWESANKY